MNPAATATLVGLAQTASVAGDLAANVGMHVAFVRAAAAAGARVVVFPELSLTGYELARVTAEPDLTLHVHDHRLTPLRRVVAELGVTAVVGAPLWQHGARVLSALVLGPEGGVRAYAKRNLFGREASVFTAGHRPLVLEVDGIRLAVGVCADLADSRQVAELVALEIDAWLVCALLGEEGYARDAAFATAVSRATGATVALANHASPTGGWTPAGRSGVWAPAGHGVDTRVAEPAPVQQLLVVPIGRRTR